MGRTRGDAERNWHSSKGCRKERRVPKKKGPKWESEAEKRKQLKIVGVGEFTSGGGGEPREGCDKSGGEKITFYGRARQG